MIWYRRWSLIQSRDRWSRFTVVFVFRDQRSRLFELGHRHPMPDTIGYHIVVSGYGLWIPGDDRGHWSEAWDKHIGYYEPHVLHEGDPVRKQMAVERLQYPPVKLSPEIMKSVEKAIADCCVASDWSIVAASIESTHTHLLMTYTTRKLDNTVKWIKDQMTKAVHRDTQHDGPVWCKGKWREYIFEQDHWDNVRAYIQQHNVRRGMGPRPYEFLSEIF